jgi:hypothetical protein
MKLQILPLLALALGCNRVNEENFPEKHSEAWCQFWEECSALSFYAEYDDHEECVDESLDVYDDLSDELSSCGFDEEKAEACIEGLQRTSCEEAAEDFQDSSGFFEDCNEVYRCD